MISVSIRRFVRTTGLHWFVAVAALLGSSVALQAATMYPASPVSPDGCKDSYYFVGPKGVKYLAVTDLGFGGTTLLVSDKGSDSHYVWYNQTLGGGNFAPCVINQGGVYHFFTVQWSPRDFRQCFINHYTYDIPNRRISSGPSRLKIIGGGAGVEDPELFRDHGMWYLLGAQWTGQNNNVHLVWMKSKNLLGPYTAPKDLLDTAGHRVDYDLRHDISHIVEAPRWSAKTHEIYWSIGPSDPKFSSGACDPAVKAIRRGKIVWHGDTPSIQVIGPAGGDDDLMAKNMDCFHLTHPDFQANGNLRATSMSHDKFVIVNVPAK